MNRKEESRQLVRHVTKLSFPVLVEQFFVVLMGIVNTMLAANIGKEAVSAIGMIDTINNIMIALFAALSIGGTVLVAQYTGQNRPDRANQSAAQALISNVIIALLVTALLAVFRESVIRLLYGEAEAIVLDYAIDYLTIVVWSYIPIAVSSVAFGILRGAGDTRTPMILSIVMNVINVPMSYLLIYGFQLQLGSFSLVIPSLGVVGAAWGITIARTTGMILVLLPLLKGNKCVVLSDWKLFKPSAPLLKGIFNLGIPASAEQLMFQGGRLITQTFIVSLGTVAIASNTIASSINALLIVPGSALSIAATTLVGQHIGAGRFHDARKQLSFLTAMASVTLAVTGSLILIILNPIISFYTRDPDIHQLVWTIVLSSIIAQPFIWPTSWILPAGLRGAGDIRYTMIVAIGSMWLVRILFGYVFAIIFAWGPIGIWIAMYADWLVRSLFFSRRVHHDDWFQKVILR